jgi:hypothetical protein
MYPRNASSPEPIGIGPVVQISDGAVQTAGVTVRVKAVGVAEADGGGTTAYSTDGIVLYTPTQAETNYTSFVLIAKKTGCIPATVTIVTSESTVSGRVYAGTVGDKTGYSLTATTGLGNQTANITGNLSGSVGSVTSGVTVTTNNDKTGYSLTQSFPANFASLAITVGGAVTAGTVSDKTGYSLTQTFPTHFNDLVISANGHVTATVDAINNNTITASAIQGGAITAAKFATDAIAAAAVSADAVTKIQAGLATATTQTTILDRLGAFTGSGVNTVLGFLKALGSKAATTPSDMGGTYSAATDATEAIRDAMQAGTGDASQATLLAVQATVDAVAASLSGSAVEVVSRVADGGSITLYAGDDMRVRSGTEVAVSVTDVGGAIYSRLNTIGVANLRFGAARPTQPAGAITGSVASLAVVGSGASQLVRVVIEIDDAGQSLAAADNYVWQLVSSRAQGSQYDTYTEIEGSLSVRRRVAVPVYS